MIQVQPTRFHQPCWEAEHVGTSYLVWAPGEVTHQGRPSGDTRDHYAAAWDRHEGRQGDFRRANTLDEVLAIFPTAVAGAFRAAITEGQ